MQDRHTNRKLYFLELAKTSEKYYVPYVHQFMQSEKTLNNNDFSVLEIGCGEGGNLLPFAKLGNKVTGIDISSSRILQAKKYFAQEKVQGSFICEDVFKVTTLGKFNLILIHDVIEHVSNKEQLLKIASSLVLPDGLVFIGFPPWQMPFGGHQQICHNKWISKIPFIHLLPQSLYKTVLTLSGENKYVISELLDIKETRTSIELFKKKLEQTQLELIDEKYYFINPHYEVKFRLYNE